MYHQLIKPFSDSAIAIVLLLVSFPIWLVIALILLTQGKGVFFTQERPGLHGKLFTLLKFKSMDDCFDEFGDVLPDELRITKIGKFLRMTSIDELPQLVNVLKGEMSLVGPRPLLPEYLDLYNANHSRRSQMRAGITGLAQVNGRNAISWNRRLDLDVEYVKKVSMVLDVSIIFTTLLKIFSTRDVNATNSSSMPKFTGYC